MAITKEKSYTFRTDQKTLDLLKKIAEKQKRTMPAVIELLIEAEAKKEKLS